MALYELTLEQQYAGQQIINRWNYISSSIPTGASGSFCLIAGMGFAPLDEVDAFFEGSIAAQLQFLQVDDVHFVQVVCKNLYSVTDFYTYAFPANTDGLQASVDGLSPTAAFGYASDRTRSDIRRAQKRFVGIPESLVGNLGVIETASRETYQDLGDTMATALVVDSGLGSITYSPNVFGREKYVVEESGKDAYRYYGTESEQLDHVAIITAFTLKNEVRTQATRQYGRGS